MDTHSLLNKLLLRSGICNKEPELLPYLIDELSNNDHYMDMLKNNPQDFIDKILRPDFLVMLMNKYRSIEKEKKDRKNSIVQQNNQINQDNDNIDHFSKYSFDQNQTQQPQPQPQPQ